MEYNYCSLKYYVQILIRTYRILLILQAMHEGNAN